MDPRRPHIEVDEGVHIALYSPLWTVSPTGEMLPRLAVDVPTVANGGLSADGLTWSVKLRPGVMSAGHQRPPTGCWTSSPCR